MPFQLFEACDGRPHAISILNRKISNQNTTHCIFTLVIESSLGLAQLALKMHAFSACVNGVSKLSLRLPFFDLHAEDFSIGQSNDMMQTISIHTHRKCSYTCIHCAYTRAHTHTNQKHTPHTNTLSHMWLQNKVKLELKSIMAKKSEEDFYSFVKRQILLFY
jgi:hypothetical protein